MSDTKKCPVCGYDKCISVNVGGSGEYPPYLYSHREGSIDLVGCTNCGVIRLSEQTLKRLKNK